jgi:hypothetical protein
MTILYGANSDQIVYADFKEKYLNELRSFLLWSDAVININVLSSTTTTPPVSPSNGARYLLKKASVNTGLWDGLADDYAVLVVWSPYAATDNTNTLAPQWIVYRLPEGVLFTVRDESNAVYKSTSDDVEIFADQLLGKGSNVMFNSVHSDSTLSALGTAGDPGLQFFETSGAIFGRIVNSGYISQLNWKMDQNLVDGAVLKVNNNQVVGGRQPAIANVSSPDATDLASVITLANELKQKMNADLSMERTHGLINP